MEQTNKHSQSLSGPSTTGDAFAILIRKSCVGGTELGVHRAAKDPFNKYLVGNQKLLKARIKSFLLLLFCFIPDSWSLVSA